MTSPTTSGHVLRTSELRPFYGSRQAVKPVTMDFAAFQITAIIGPSGCGKSTVLRCLNRMHETIPNARAEGQVLLDSVNIYASDTDATLVRRKIGMVFQQPVALRTRTIYENIAIGLRLGGINAKSELDGRVEKALRQAALWDEVKNKMNQAGTALSGGQQQRLSIARSLAVEPDVLLFDEPCSALDPISTYKIEELLLELRKSLTIIIVTHNMQQAARISDRTAVFLVDRIDEKNAIGELVEYEPTEQIFTTPKDTRTADYIAGKVG